MKSLEVVKVAVLLLVVAFVVAVFVAARQPAAARGGVPLAGAPRTATPARSLAATVFRSTRSKQREALPLIQDAREKCVRLSDSVSGRWRTAIDMGLSDAGLWIRDLYEKDPDGEVAAARSSRATAEATMADGSLRDGEAGGALLDLYTTTQQICALALSPAGHSLVTYNEETARLATTATGLDARLKVLLGP